MKSWFMYESELMGEEPFFSSMYFIVMYFEAVSWALPCFWE